MWELELICDQRNSKYFKYLQENLRIVLQRLGGVSALFADKNFVYMSFGAKDEVTPELKANIRLALCDVFCEKMKFDYLKANIDIPNKQPEMRDTFLKVCTYFDRETERQIVLNSLELKWQKFNIESFLYFRLQGLVKKWQELCDLTNEHCVTIMHKENFIEMLRFLLNSIDSKCKSVILELQDECIIYRDERSNFDMITTIKSDNKYDILSKLIDLNPYLIKVHAKENDAEIVNLLRSVFDDRVETS